MLSDDELAYWGNYGRLVSPTTTLLDGLSPGQDLVALWNMFGALEAKVRAMSDDD